MPELFSHVLNVISADADALAGPVRAAVASLGAAGEIAWLSAERAFDIPFLGTPENICAAARETAKGLEADINAVASAHRRKQLLIADMDSTIITAECLDELADMVGLKAEISAITERAMRGELEFEPALRERVSHLKGLRLDALEQVMRERIRLTPGAKALVHTMRKQGAHTLLVSGGFTFFTQRVAALTGFDAQRANCAARRRPAPDRHGARTDPGARGQAGGAGARSGRPRPRHGADAGGRRRRQRSGDDPAGGAGRRLSRQAAWWPQRPARASTTPI